MRVFVPGFIRMSEQFEYKSILTGRDVGSVGYIFREFRERR